MGRGFFANSGPNWENGLPEAIFGNGHQEGVWGRSDFHLSFERVNKKIKVNQRLLIDPK